MAAFPQSSNAQSKPLFDCIWPVSVDHIALSLRPPTDLLNLPIDDFSILFIFCLAAPESSGVRLRVFGMPSQKAWKQTWVESLQNQYRDGNDVDILSCKGIFFHTKLWKWREPRLIALFRHPVETWYSVLVKRLRSPLRLTEGVTVIDRVNSVYRDHLHIKLRTP